MVSPKKTTSLLPRFFSLYTEIFELIDIPIGLNTIFMHDDKKSAEPVTLFGERSLNNRRVTLIGSEWRNDQLRKDLLHEFAQLGQTARGDCVTRMEPL